MHPKVPSNVVLIDGYIEDTLPLFIRENKIKAVSFIHIDTDTYSPAYTVLSLLKPYISTGTIILFDELCGYPNWRNHEWLALEQVFQEDEYEFLGFANGQGRPNLMSAAIMIK